MWTWTVYIEDELFDVMTDREMGSILTFFKNVYLDLRRGVAQIR